MTKLRKEKKEKLLSEVKNREQELTKTQLNLALGKFKNPRKLKELRREIAQLKTVLREQELIEELGKEA